MKAALNNRLVELYHKKLNVAHPIFSERRHLITILVFLSICLVSIGLWWLLRSHEKEEARAVTKLSAEQVARGLQDRLDSHLAVVNYLREEWLRKGQMTQEEFTQVVLAIVSQYEGFQAINYINPQGIIEWVVPESPNLPARGKDLHTHPYAAESFVLAEQTGQDIITPIIELWQGGAGFATYFPLLKEGQLQGYLNGVFRVDRFLPPGWMDVVSDYYELQLLAEGERFYASITPMPSLTSKVYGEVTFPVLNRFWTVSLVPKAEVPVLVGEQISHYFLIFGVILAFLVAGLTHIQLKRQLTLHKNLQRIHESETQHRMLVDHSPDGIIIHTQGKIVFVNTAFLNMMKVNNPDELIGKDFLEVVHPRYREQVRDRIRTVIQQGVEVGSVEMQYLRGDGSILEVEVSAIPVTFEGQPAAEVVIHNITDRKKSQRLQNVVYEISQAVSTSENLKELFTSIYKQLSNVLDTTNFYIALYDKTKNLLSFPYFIDQVDPPPEPKPLGKGLSEYVMRTKKPLMIDEKGIYELAEQGAIELIGTPSKIWLGVPLSVKGEVIGVMVVQSYSDPLRYTKADLDVLTYTSEQIAVALHRKRADDQVRNSEQKYRQAADDLGRSNTMKEMLLDVISHDLKNPSSVIHGMSDLLAKEFPENDMINLIKESSTNLLGTLENAKTISMVALGEEIEKQPLNVKKLLETVISEYRRALKDKNMQVEFDVPGDLEIKANPILAEVFRNYLSNAIKYASEGKRVIIRARVENGYLVGKVVDFGATLPKKYWKDVFKRKLRLEQNGEKGRGLGLAIVERIAEAHRGKVWVEANEPHGNIFCIKIPIK